jgi:hypothetical protein
MRNLFNLFLCLLFLLILPACNPGSQNQDEEKTSVELIQAGWLDADELLEASGIQASFSHPGHFFVHNDDAPSLLYVIDATGNDLGAVGIEPVRITDLEDITSVPVADNKRWVVAGNIGDNFARREFITLYFAEEPQPDASGYYNEVILLQHRLDLTYPDGPRDCESLAYDPIGNRLLLISKRDKPARLYSIDLETALRESQAELTFLGTIASLRAPTGTDRGIWGNRADYISQPTGFDISPDGNEAAIITYRSIYRFKREANEDWQTALQRQPQEVVGPPAPQNEAVAYSSDGANIFVTSEKIPAPLFRFTFSDPDPANKDN